MDIRFDQREKERSSLEFVQYYERKLSEWMDPFRRCRAGGFDARELEPFLLEAFLAFGGESQKKTLDRLFDKTNELFDEYYKETRSNFCIAPDVFAHRNEVESELKGIKEKNLEKIST